MTSPLSLHASLTRVAPRVRAASSCVVFSRRSPSTRWVVSVTVTRTPPTVPDLLPDRAVGEDEIALLGEAVPVQRQHEIDERRRRPLHDAGEHRADDVPDLGERLARARAHRARVLRRPEDGAVAVVVELRVFRSPRDVHREAGLEQDAERGAQALRPCRHGPDDGSRPVDGPHQSAHLTAAA